MVQSNFWVFLFGSRTKLHGCLEWYALDWWHLKCYYNWRFCGYSQMPCLFFHRFLMLQLFLLVTCFFLFLFVACYLGLITLIYHSSQTPCLYFHRFLMLQLFLFITWFLPFVLCYLGLIALICHSRGELVTVRYMV